MTQPAVITADFANVRGPRSRQANICVGSGRAALGLRRDWQEHLALAGRECGFRYVRFHGMFHDDMGVVRRKADGTLAFNWHYLDLLYDGILAAGLRPFVEFGFMPACMASGDQTIFWWKGNVTPPRDLGEWRQLIAGCARHFEERYGREEIKQWYFEVWNEPNLQGFWTGTQEDYFRLYDVTAQAVKGVCPEFRVGGPATAGNAWISAFTEHCHAGGVPLDFFSTHDYGVAGGGLDEFGTEQHWLHKERDAIAANLWSVSRKLAASRFPKAELHYTEWSASWSSRDPIHDSYFSAAYILDKAKQADRAVTSMSYWTFTDIFEEAGPPPAPFHGGFGLLTREGLRKPSFFAHRFLNALGPDELENSDPCSWVCRGENGLTALFWDFSQPAQEAEPNQKFFARDLPAGPRAPRRLTVTNLPAGTYELQVHRVGYRSNDAYAAYLDLGAPAGLSRPQVAHLARLSSGEPERAEKVVIGGGGTWDAEFTMRENDVCFVSLTHDRGTGRLRR